MEYKTTKIGNLVDINQRNLSKDMRIEYMYYLDTGNITRNRVDEIKCFDVKKDKIPSRARRIPKEKSILYSTVRPNQEHYGYLDGIDYENLIVSTGFVVIDVYEEIANSKYIYYFLTQNHITDYLQKIAETSVSTYPSIKPSDIEQLSINLPLLSYQNKVVSILSSFDKKIETNNAIIANLEAQAQAIFKSWFIDFEPFQDGEFVESELGLIPKGWEVKTLGDFFPVITGKKNANIAIDNGEYPFFTCSQGIFYTDDYSFDANAILLAGNGDFNVKRYNGKFEAYQRTYILIPYDEKYVGLLYNLIEFYLPQIVSGHKGSVINYITKGMIEEFKFAVPNDIPAKTLKLFNDYENFIAHLKKEVKNLEITRDTLLPKLMSGEIDVSNIKVDAEEDSCE